MNIKPCAPKSNGDLAREWDRLAVERHRQITSGEDLSFDHVVMPVTWNLLEGVNRAFILDIGCGTGHFTLRLAGASRRVVAIDPSSASIAVARKVCQGADNVEFVEAPLEEAAMRLSELATSAVAVMTLMTVPDIWKFAQALAMILQPGGQFVAVMTHPWFWPRYWGYEKEPWFAYDSEIFIEAPFVISNHRTEIKTTHVHRSLARYVSVFVESGFRLDALVEPMPPTEIRALYPKPWRFPRFLGLRWEKIY